MESRIIQFDRQCKRGEVRRKVQWGKILARRRFLAYLMLLQPILSQFWRALSNK